VIPGTEWLEDVGFITNRFGKLTFGQFNLAGMGGTEKRKNYVTNGMTYFLLIHL
jgi:hypothetical protein